MGNRDYTDWNSYRVDIYDDGKQKVSFHDEQSASTIVQNINKDVVDAKPNQPEKLEKTNGIVEFYISPYDDNDRLYKSNRYQFKPGVTVLVGCNGCGKSTLLKQIKEDLKKKKIPVMSFDNLQDGGSHARSCAIYEGNFEFMATSACSSEGENIVMNLGRMASTLRPFIQTGESQDRGDRLCKAFAAAVWGDDKTEVETPKERWILLDAIDSGLSVDNVVDVKEYLFKTILNDAPDDVDIFILVACNEYELARNENCFDVYNGKYIRFQDYEEYREFVLNSRQVKDRRYEKSAEKAAKRKETKK